MYQVEYTLGQMLMLHMSVIPTFVCNIPLTALSFFQQDWVSSYLIIWFDLTILKYSWVTKNTKNIILFTRGVDNSVVNLIFLFSSFSSDYWRKYTPCAWKVTSNTGRSWSMRWWGYRWSASRSHQSASIGWQRVMLIYRASSRLTSPYQVGNMYLLCSG